MSAFPSGQKAINRGEIAPQTSNGSQRLPSSEITHNNSRVDGCCADYRGAWFNP